MIILGSVILNGFVCNIIAKQTNFLLVFMHNLSAYAAHLFFKELVAKKNPKKSFRVCPKTNESFISITYGSLRFIDSMRILQRSLVCLSNSLKVEDLIIPKTN